MTDVAASTDPSAEPVPPNLPAPETAAPLVAELNPTPPDAVVPSVSAVGPSMSTTLVWFGAASSII